MFVDLSSSNSFRTFNLFSLFQPSEIGPGANRLLNLSWQRLQTLPATALPAVLPNCARQGPHSGCKRLN